VASPKGFEVEFPYGNADAPIPGLNDEEQPNRKRKQHPVKPKGAKKLKLCDSEKKFSSVHLSSFSNELNLDHCINLPSQMKNPFWFKKSKNLIAKSVSKSTWKTRNAALRKLLIFSKQQSINIIWPLKDDLVNGFIVWNFANKTSPTTINSYIFALSSLQKTMGFNPINVKNTQASALLKGISNSCKKKKLFREPVTLKSLSKIKKKIETEISGFLTKKAIWSAFTLAFFGCCRMGELVCEKESIFHPKNALCWEDINLEKKCLTLNLKSTKTNKKDEKVYIFKFKDKNVCPIHAFVSYKNTFEKTFEIKGKEPVFRSAEGSLLTKKFLNKFLKSNFKGLSCHSFRAGIPSAIAKIPNELFKKQIMNFGRWNSNSFSSYQKYKLYQKKWIFNNIENALLGNKDN
jgi:integrase